jgi:hypothetical protein
MKTIKSDDTKYQLYYTIGWLMVLSLPHKNSDKGDNMRCSRSSMIVRHTAGLLRPLLLSMWCCYAAPSQALISAQIFKGWNHGTFNGTISGDKPVEVTGGSTSVAVLIDPLPLIPIAFGVGASFPQGNLRDSNDNKLSYTGHQFDVEIMAWSPISLSSLTPYLRAGHIIAGSSTYTQIAKIPVSIGSHTSPAGAENKYRLGAAGNFVGLGLRFDFLAVISFMGEARVQISQLPVQQVDFAGTDITDDVPKQSYRDMNFMIGASVGI